MMAMDCSAEPVRHPAAPLVAVHVLILVDGTARAGYG